jgi:hypothetical protein
LAPTSLNMTSSGNTTVYLNTLMLVDASACTSGGLQANSSSCPNYGMTVVTQQVPVGSTTRASHLATPSSSICSSSTSYKISTANYLKDATARVTNSPIALTDSSQIAYVSEMIVQSSDLSFWNTLGTGWNYSVSVF